MSTTLSPIYPASHAIDGNTASLAATEELRKSDQWISVEFETTTRIGKVEVYNREDGPPFENWLSPYEVWLGNSFGAQTYSCSGGLIMLDDLPGIGPFGTDCGNITLTQNLSFVSIVIGGGNSTSPRYLTIGEIKAYEN